MFLALSHLNPEFQRNVWKEFSLHRLIAMPLILGVIFYISTSGSLDKISSIPEVALHLILLLLVVWGTGLSADAIFEEIQDHTWETQRMTPLGAWSMAWGKLFGTTSYVWYGTFICVAALLIANFFNPPTLGIAASSFNFNNSLFDVIYCLLIGIGAQAFSFFCALLIQRISPVRSRARVTLIQIFAIFVFLSWYGFGKALLPKIYTEHSWYNLNISYPIFILLSQVFIIFWLLLGIYRLLRNELQVKTIPWVWPFFVISWSLYCLGYVYISKNIMGQEVPALVINAWYWGVTYFIMLSLTFLAAFFSSKNIIHAYRFVEYLKQHRYLQAITIMPVWLLSLALACCALIPFVTYALQGSEIEGKTFSLELTAFAFSMILFLLRDISILYFLCWNPRAKRAHLATVVYLILLYVFVPIVLSLLGFPSEWLATLSPGAWFTKKAITVSQIISINLVIALEIGLIMYGVVYRWQQNKIRVY